MIEKRKLKNQILKILRRKDENKSRSTAEIYLSLTPEKLDEVLSVAVVNYEEAIEHYYDGVQEFIYDLMSGCQLDKLVPIPEYSDAGFQQRAKALNNLTVTEVEFKKIAMILKISNPNWKPDEDSRTFDYVPQIKGGIYNDKEVVEYLTGEEFNQFKKSIRIKILRQKGMDYVPAGSSFGESVKIIRTEFKEYQLLFIKLYFGTLEQFVSSLIERTSHLILQDLSSKNKMMSYIKEYVLPQFNGCWPVYNNFLSDWRPPKNHPSALTIGDRIYTYFGDGVSTQSVSPRYRKREKGLWRKVGEKLNAKVESGSRRAFTKNQLDEKLKTIHNNGGALSQHFIRKNHSGLISSIIRYYKKFTNMQTAITEKPVQIHIADDKTVLDSYAEKLLYNHLLKIRSHADWLYSIEVHQLVFLADDISKKFSVDFVINANLFVEVEMIDSRGKYKNRLHKSYAARNSIKRKWYAQKKLKYIFVQQEDCFSDIALAATVKKLIDLNESPFPIEDTSKIGYQKHRLGLNYWRQEGVVEKEFKKAKQKALSAGGDSLTLLYVFNMGVTGLRDAFYKLPKEKQRALIKDIDQQLTQTPQFVDGKLTETAWNALQERLRTSRGVFMSDKLYNKFGFTSVYNFSVMLTLRRHFGSFKDLAVHFGLGWLPNTRSICFELNSVRIEKDDVKKAIESLPAVTDDKLEKLKEYLTGNSETTVRKVQNSFCYEDGEMLPLVKNFIESSIRDGVFYPLKKCNAQLAEYITKTISTKKFYEEIGYHQGMPVEDWLPPKVWPRLILP
ncbi:hypothetical protein [Pseudoalteromonas distincta]|uniref:hypothetical protein n=1 Tax=Pseudoalteromonas distincta TaxID=77608 RepID=UPI0011F1C685|nr:hypothetical protein [Pseudoalteromonas distincta]KAA1163159.1 hypothetical protein EU511_03435 [Pseudoalteromonas distincta]